VSAYVPVPSADRSTRARSGQGRAAGFSLVELMIALVLGLLLIGGTITIFTANVRSAELGQAIATMQANARYALDEMTRDVRAAGFRGCADADDTRLEVSMAGAPLDATNPGASAVLGAGVETGGWNPSLPPGYTPPSGSGAPVVGTEALLVQYAEAPGEALLADMSGTSGALAIAGERYGLEAGDLAIVSGCGGGDLFGIDTRAAVAGGVSLQPSASLSSAYAIETGEGGVTRVMPFVSVLYYIGDTGRRTGAGDVVRSLYRQSFPYTFATNPPLELVEGVDQLRLAFGMSLPSGETRFVRASDAGYDPAAVTSVRVGLLTSSRERLDGDASTRRFSLAGQSVQPASGTATGAVYPADQRLRIGFERSVTVRNRALAGRSL